jgi:hypothetical protein
MRFSHAGRRSMPRKMALGRAEYFAIGLLACAAKLHQRAIMFLSADLAAAFFGSRREFFAFLKPSLRPKKAK